MAPEDEEDLYDEEFDFVDDDDDEDDDLDDESDIVDEAEAEPEIEAKAKPAPARGRRRPADEREDEPEEAEAEAEAEADSDDEPVDEYGRTEPKADYVVHVYEHSKFKRTIERPFTPEDAETFVTEYNRTAKSYGRVAVPSKNDAKPKKTLDNVRDG